MKKLTLIMVILMLVVIAFTSCSQSGGDSKEIVITIPHYKAGENVGAKFFLPQVERFNEKYKGKYKVVIEELVQANYSEKMKLLAQQNKLPPLIEGGDTDWLTSVVIPNELFMDLKPWLDENPEYKERYIPENLEYNTHNGKIVTYPYPVIRPIGLYYNSSMLTPEKPIGEMTCEEFEAFLGEEKIAFMTGENAWTTALFHAALMASEPGGPEYMRSCVLKKERNYNNEYWVNSTAKLQKLLQKYASSNTVGAVYADAANNFMSKGSAVIANGSWMVGDFAPDSSDKWSNGFDGADVRGAVFPGNVALANTYGYGWWIPKNISDKEKEAALAFLEFIMSPEELEAYMLQEGGTAPRLEVSEDFLKERAKNKLLDEYVGAVNSETIIVPTLNDMCPQSIMDNEYGKLLPKLIDGSMTPEEFCAELTKKASETALD